MKLSINSGLFCSIGSWLPSYLLDEVIRRLASIGYPAIEISAASPHAFPKYTDKRMRNEIATLLSEQGMEVSSICPSLGGGPGFNPASPIEAERKACIDYTKECIDLAIDLGSKIVIWLGGWMVYGVSKDQAWEWCKKALIECAKYADSKGISVVIEPTPVDSDVIETIDDAISLMRETKHSNVKVMLDTYMLFYRNEVMEDCVRKAGKDLAHIHVSDIDRLPPGHGDKDFRPFIKALREINYDGIFTLDLTTGSRCADGFAYALQAYEYLTPLLKEV